MVSEGKWPRVFLGEGELLPGRRARVAGPEAHHLRTVLRKGPGDPVWLLDGAGRMFPGVIVAVSAGGLTVEVGTPRAAPGEPPVDITLVQALAKGDRFDWVVEKATELGVTRILPAETRRSVVRLGAERAAGRVQRWRRIAREAARQCRRARVPEVAAPAPWEACLAAVGRSSGPAGGLAFLLWEQAAEGPGLLAALQEHGRLRGDGGLPAGAGAEPAGVALLVGPEGGLERDEVEMACANGIRPVSLGPRILRTETAAVAALAVVAAWLEGGGAGGREGPPGRNGAGRAEVEKQRTG